MEILPRIIFPFSYSANRGHAFYQQGVNSCFFVIFLGSLCVPVSSVQERRNQYGNLLRIRLPFSNSANRGYAFLATGGQQLSYYIIFPGGLCILSVCLHRIT